MKPEKSFIYIIAIWMLTTNFMAAHPSWGIVVDKNRNIYFADITHNGRGSVWMLSKEGKIELLLEDFHAHNVSLDEDGNLVTAHGENNHAMVRLINGKIADTIYQSNDHSAFFGGNCTYSPLGEIVFGIDKHLWRINQNGKKEKVSDYKFGWNQTVYTDDLGNYYAPDIGSGVGELLKINSKGEASLLATNLISKSKAPYDPHADILMGITKGCDGHIYIAEIAGKRIIKILDAQKVETFYRSEGDWFPTGIDFFAGVAYILEFKTKGGNEGPRITKVDESGRITELFNYDKFKEGDTIPVRREKNQDSNWWLYTILAGISFSGIIIRSKNYFHNMFQRSTIRSLR